MPSMLGTNLPVNRRCSVKATDRNDETRTAPEDGDGLALLDENLGVLWPLHLELEGKLLVLDGNLGVVLPCAWRASLCHV